MDSRVFVVMPFGVKEALPAAPPAGGMPARDALLVNFDEIYTHLIAPALAGAGCIPFRADKEKSAGDIRTDMFFELVTADVVVADISILNPNVFYELGVRHGVAPRGVFMVHGGWSRRPFDIAPDRTFDYDGKLFESPADQRGDPWRSRLTVEVERLSRVFREALEDDEQTIGSPVYKEVVGLKPVDWSQVSTARAKYFGQVFAEWQSRVKVARRNGLPGDILTLADDAPTRLHRTRLLWEAARALIGMYRFGAARPVLEELIALAPGHLDAQCQLGLTLAHLGNTSEALVHMSALVDQFSGDPELQGILGRVYKDLWRLEWDKPESTLEERQKEAVVSSQHAAGAIASYSSAYLKHLNSYFNGINVVSLVKLLEHLRSTTGRRPADHGTARLQDLIAAVRLAAGVAREGAEEASNHEEAIWATATLGEIELVAGDAEQACDFYEMAANTPEVTYFQVDSMLSQVRLLDRLGFRPAAVAAVRNILEQRLGKLARPQARFEKVLVCSGHMIDEPGRKPPRFPPEKEALVRDAMARRLDKWGIGARDLAICGGARGADILFAECCVERGAEVWLFIALDEGEFLEESVRLPDSNWEDRFHVLCEHERVKTFTQNSRIKAPPRGTSPFARVNLWIINTARAEAKNSRSIYAILVWDEQPTGDGLGGTSDFAARVERVGGHLAVINPTKLGGD